MTNDDLKQLIANKTILDFETGDQDFDHGLRLVLRDNQTGAIGLLAIEPLLMYPDESECVLKYSYQDMEAELGPPPEECLILNLKTKVGPDFEKGEIPFLFS